MQPRVGPGTNGWLVTLHRLRLNCGRACVLITMAATPVLDVGSGSGTALAFARSLRWEFKDLADCVQVLSTAAGGLAMARRRLEQHGGWKSARDDLAEVLADRVMSERGVVVLDDPLLITACRVPQ